MVIKMVTTINLPIDICLCLPPFKALKKGKAEIHAQDKIKLKCKWWNLVIISGHQHEIKHHKMVEEVELTLNWETYHKQAPALLSDTQSWDKMVFNIHRALPKSTEELLLSPSFKLSKEMMVIIRWLVVTTTVKDTLRCMGVKNQKAHFEEPSPIMVWLKTQLMENRI